MKLYKKYIILFFLQLFVSNSVFGYAEAGCFENILFTPVISESNCSSININFEISYTLQNSRLNDYKKINNSNINEFNTYFDRQAYFLSNFDFILVTFFDRNQNQEPIKIYLNNPNINPKLLSEYHCSQFYSNSLFLNDIYIPLNTLFDVQYELVKVIDGVENRQNFNLYFKDKISTTVNYVAFEFRDNILSSYEKLSINKINDSYDIVYLHHTFLSTNFSYELFVDGILVKTGNKDLSDGDLIDNISLESGFHVIQCRLFNATEDKILSIEVDDGPDDAPLTTCCSTFKPEPGETYWISGWVSEDNNIPVKTFINSEIGISFYDENLNLKSVKYFKPSGDIIDEWQRIVGDFIIPENTYSISVELRNISTNNQYNYFDDIRIHPFNSSMKSYVYNPTSMQLEAELDDNNYATFYEYDQEGQLMRIKKETSRGIMTIQESRTSNPKTFE
jgi:hypothetical protein